LAGCHGWSRPSRRNRYERKRPGELVHIDVKKLGRISGGAGHRVTGDRRRQGSSDHSARSTGQARTSSVFPLHGLAPLSVRRRAPVFLSAQPLITPLPSEIVA
jgi:hypothetical protein